MSNINITLEELDGDKLRISVDTEKGAGINEVVDKPGRVSLTVIGAVIVEYQKRKA